MKCPECSFENREGARFCKECGHKLELACPDCGNPFEVGTKFCDECGHNLRKAGETVSIDYTEPQSYTPKHLAEKILTDRSAIEGERKLVTVLFADVAGFTSISEKLDPEEVHQFMDGSFKILMDEVHRHEGTINQFTGDGIMALFGAPVAHEEHAQSACRASLAIQKAMTPYGEKIERETGAEFKMRIGLNSGQVIVGSIGDDLRMDYTAVGDTTNLAARMESAARPGGILVSKNTQRLAREYFEFEALDRLEVKGKEEPQEVFVLVKASDVGTRFGASVAKGLTRFVGRRNSLNFLHEIYERAAAGSGQVVGMVGEAGVGKSRLLLEFRNRLSPDTYTYLEGQCLHYGEAIPYLPVRDILKSFFGIEVGDREFILKKKIRDRVLVLDKTLENALPSFHELLSVKSDDEKYLKLEPLVKREKVFEAIRDILILESGKRPIIITVEDLHWIDRTSEEFLDYLIEWLANTRIMLILLYRNEYRHQWGSKTYYNRIGLDHLGPESSVELVRAMLEGGEVASELKELILSRSAGNPLFMEEFTHTLLENGSIQEKDHCFFLNRDMTEIQVPETIQGIIAARMDRLEDNLKRTMQVASVIGRDFAFGLLQTIMGMREELKSYLLNLQGLEFIYEKQLFPELEYIFKHALTKEVAYNSLLLKHRKEIHEKIGRAIEEIYADRLEEFYEMLAYHYMKSENHEKAYDYLHRSGNRATDRHSPWEAFNFYRQAASALNSLPESEHNNKKLIEIYLALHTPMVILGHPEDSFQMLKEGERLSREAGDEKSLAYFWSYLVNYYGHKMDIVSGLKYGEDGFRLAEKLNDLELMASTAGDLCYAYQAIGEHSKVIDLAPRIIKALEREDKTIERLGWSVPVYPALCTVTGYSMGELGNFGDGEAMLQKGLSAAERTGNPGSLANAELDYGFFFISRGAGMRIIEHCQKSIKYSEESNWASVLHKGWMGLGIGHYFLGELETARTYLEKGLKVKDETGVEYLVSLLYCFLGLVLYELGQSDRGLDLMKKAFDTAVKSGEKAIEGIAGIWLGRILSDTEPSQLDEAEEMIRQGTANLEKISVRPHISIGYFFLGELHQKTGRKQEALEYLHQARQNFQDMGMDYWLTKTEEVLGSI